MKTVTGIIILLLFLASSSIAANSPFGLHAVDGDGLSVQELGVKQIRIAALTWDSLEPQKGNYDFSATDNAILNLQGKNVSLIVGTLRAINMWGGNFAAQVGYNPKDPLTANSGFPSDIGAWKAFIRTLVERYDGDGVNDMPGLVYPIKYWQIEGEWMWQWKDSTANYLKFLNITSKEIKKADPSANVVAGAVTGAIAFAVGEGFDKTGYFEKDNGAGVVVKISQNQLLHSKQYRRALKKARALLKYGKGSFDIIDTHLYSRESYRIVPAMDWLKFTMANFGYQKPVWSLENAGPFYGYTENLQAEEVVKRYLFSITSGIDKTFWSSLHITPGWPVKYLRLSLIDGFTRRKPAFLTYKLVLPVIDGFNTIESLNVGAGVYCFKVNKPNSSSYIMWSDTGATASLPIAAANVQITDTLTLQKWTMAVGNGLLNIQLSEDPVIVEPF